MTALALSRAAMLAGEAQGRVRGIALSLLVHVGLIVAIAFGVSWRSRTPEAQQAELWAAVPQAAAARAVEPEPAPPPAAVAEKPAPRPAPAPPPPQPDAQIAIEKARVEAKARAAAAEREAQRAKLEAAAAAEKARQQQAAEERAAQQREAERKKNLERMLGQAGAETAGTTGSAMQSSGPSASYAGMIVARLKRENNFGGAVAGNPKAEVEIRVGPDGAIVGRRLLKSSGVAAWDDAVLRAIDKAGSLPRDVDGRVQNPTLIVWGPRD